LPRIHSDWKSKIHDVLRAKLRSKLTGDYIQQSLDYFDMVLPMLKLRQEVVMKREEFSRATNGEWSESSITKFFHHLAKTEVLDCRSAGAKGIGVTLLRDLTVSPWKSRRPDAQHHEVPSMNPPPIPNARFEAPSDEDYCTSVDLDLTLAALDTVARNLLTIDLSFARNFAGEPAEKLYSAQDKVARAVRDLERIRAALGTGDETDLEGIVGRSRD
jgi:hypothetical protein